MKIRFTHSNISVLDLERSLAFYDVALHLKEDRRQDFGDFVMVYLQDEVRRFELEIRWTKGRTEAYELGENPTHLAFMVDDYESLLRVHQKMGCITFVNEALGLHFMKDPDGYAIEIMREDFFERLPERLAKQQH